MRVRREIKVKAFDRMIAAHPAPEGMSDRNAFSYRRTMFDNWLIDHDCYLDWGRDGEGNAFYVLFLPDKRTEMLFKLAWHV